jgi:carbon-monoxide dehydrogenase large subunit
VATGAALANAVAQALAPLGVQVTELPLSPNRIREWIQQAESGVSGAGATGYSGKEGKA